MEMVSMPNLSLLIAHRSYGGATRCCHRGKLEKKMLALCVLFNLCDHIIISKLSILFKDQNVLNVNNSEKSPYWSKQVSLTLTRLPMSMSPFD